MVKQKSISAEQALKLGKAAAAEGNKAEAEKYFNAVLVKYPDNKDAIKGIKSLNPNNLYRDDLDELKKLLKNGKYNEVETKAGMYLELYPEVSELYGLLGTSVGARGDHKQALTYFLKAAELSPFGSGVQYNLALAYKSNGDIENAIKCYKSTIKNDRKFVPAYSNLGNIYMYKEEYDRAIEVLTAAAKIVPDFPDVLMSLATAYKAKGEYAKSIAFIKKVIISGITTAPVLMELAICENLNGNPDEAKLIYEDVTREAPEIFDAHNNYGNLLKDAGDNEAAISHFEKAIEINSAHPVPYGNLGLLYHELGDEAKANEYREKAQALQPVKH